MLGAGRRRATGADRGATLRRPLDVRPLVALAGVLFVGVLAFGLYGLLNPTVLPAVPKAKSNPAIGLLFAGAFFLIVLLTRAVRTYLLTRRAADLRSRSAAPGSASRSSPTSSSAR